MKEENGYTVVETLIAFMLTFIVAGIIFSIYIFTVKYINEWQKNLEIENAFHLILNRISEDVYLADEIISISDKGLILKMASGKPVIYRYTAKTLARNGHLMLKNGLFISKFRAAALDGNQRAIKANYSEIFTGEQIVDISSIEIQIALTDGRQTLASGTTVAPRKSISWTPLK